MEENIRELEENMAELAKSIEQLDEFRSEAVRFMEKSLSHSHQTNQTLLIHAENIEQLKNTMGKIIRTLSELSTLIRKQK